MWIQTLHGYMGLRQPNFQLINLTLSTKYLNKDRDLCIKQTLFLFFLLGNHLIHKKVPNKIKLFAWRACKEILAINRNLEKNGKNHRKSLWHVQESKWKHSSCSGRKCKCEYTSKVWNIAFPIIQILNGVQWHGKWRIKILWLHWSCFSHHGMTN